MRINLEGRTALVTGSTSGIGRAVAAGLHEAGASVVVTGRSQQRVDETVEALGGGDRLRGVAADLGTEAGCATVAEAVPAVDVLVNNAAIFEDPVGFFDLSEDDWLRFFQINTMSGVRLARHYVPGMVERGWGRVSFVSSEAGLQTPPSMVHYGVTKTAQLAVARGLAETVAGSGVTVNSVIPGPTDSEGLRALLHGMVGNGAGDFDEAKQMLIEHTRTLLRRCASCEEVANMVVYLASEQASATTGSVVRADGGTVRALA
jgi:NAD(P)-dependent dehydrogenase (short-subunit alcohol dehydrogenase family)